MITMTKPFTAFAAALLLLAATASLPGNLRAQISHPQTMRDFLLQFKGKEVLILDKTTGSEQFVTGDPSKAYDVVLDDVQKDYIVVSRNTDSDKRTFLYPLAIIRRIIFEFDGKPYDKIVIEMY